MAYLILCRLWNFNSTAIRSDPSLHATLTKARDPAVIQLVRSGLGGVVLDGYGARVLFARSAVCSFSLSGAPHLRDAAIAWERRFSSFLGGLNSALRLTAVVPVSAQTFA